MDTTAAEENENAAAEPMKPTPELAALFGEGEG